MDSRQALLFDADSHDSETSSISDSSHNTFEMTGLEEVPVTPAPKRPDPTTYDNGSDDESDSDYEDNGDQALLGSRTRTRGRERSLSSEKRVGTLKQVQGIIAETVPTLLLTTVGVLLTGEVLNHVSRSRAMVRIDELIIIIPVVLNLKGNLEMNLSARLGTAANMGELDSPDVRKSIILGSLTLLQVQATFVSFVAACVAFIMGRILPDPPRAGENVDLSVRALHGMFHIAARHLEARGPHRPAAPRPPTPTESGFAEFAVVAASAMTAACLSSVILGSFMCGLIVLCRNFGLDPDNIAPPIAACLGDLVTLALLGMVSSAMFPILHTPGPLIIIILLFVAGGGWLVLTQRNIHVKHLLTQGWSPLFAAMIVSCGTGAVLDTFVERYKGFALLAVAIAGLPGGVSAIFVSRLSTALHAAKVTATSHIVSILDINDPKQHPSSRLVMATLVIVSIPIEILFLVTVHTIGWVHLPFLFITLQLLFFLIAISISLTIGLFLTKILWRWNLDPDMYCLPIQSALTDLSSQLLLVACYEIASSLGMKVVPKQH